MDKRYLDKWGMLTTLEGDGGDSAFHMGHYYSLLAFGGEPKKTVDGLKPLYYLSEPYGFIRRHINSDKWYGDTDRASRDQSLPYTISLFLNGYLSPVKKVFLSHLKRGLLFTTNVRRNGTTKENHGERYGEKTRNYSFKIPDFTGPTFWSIYIRGFRAWPFYFLLMVCDIFLILKVLFFNLKPREPNQLLILLEFSKARMPTPLSWLAVKVLNMEKVYFELESYWFKLVGGEYVRPYFIGEMWIKRLKL